MIMYKIEKTVYIKKMNINLSFKTIIIFIQKLFNKTYIKLVIYLYNFNIILVNKNFIF